MYSPHVLNFLFIIMTYLLVNILYTPIKLYNALFYVQARIFNYTIALTEIGKLFEVYRI